MMGQIHRLHFSFVFGDGSTQGSCNHIVFILDQGQDSCHGSHFFLFLPFAGSSGRRWFSNYRLFFP